VIRCSLVFFMIKPAAFNAGGWAVLCPLSSAL
jgi:hypothetical protein